MPTGPRHHAPRPAPFTGTRKLRSCENPVKNACRNAPVTGLRSVLSAGWSLLPSAEQVSRVHLFARQVGGAHASSGSCRSRARARSKAGWSSRLPPNNRRVCIHWWRLRHRLKLGVYFGCAYSPARSPAHPLVGRRPGAARTCRRRKFWAENLG